MPCSRALVAMFLASVALATAPPAHAQAEHLPFVGSITTEPAPPCPDSSYQLVVRGVFPTACARVLAAKVAGATEVELRIQTPYPAAMFCLPDSLPWEHRFEMPGLAPSRDHVVTVRMVVVDETVSGIPPATYETGIPVHPSTTCDSIPGPDPLSFVSRVFIGALGPDDVPRPWICPTDPIVVTARGWLPNDCYELRKIELLPSPIAAPFPAPPIVRFVFDDRGCLDRPCAEVATAWWGRTVIPPLPTGNHFLIVEAAIVTCRDSVLPGDPLAGTTYPFRVTSADSCGPPAGACLWPSWDHSSNANGCDAVLDGEGRAGATMQVASSVALAGLEGVIRLHPPGMGLRIRSLEPVGPAAGMTLQTSPADGGVRFVLFAGSGAPIPPSDVLGGVPVLRVSLETYPVLPAVVLPDRWTLTADELLGADEAARPVPLCPIRTVDGTNLVAEMATVCRRASCDYNHDGRQDVLDLVGMVRCLNGLPPCDSGAVVGVDCRRDGDFDLDDVVCCGLSMLQSHPCRTCPPDSTRPAPRVSLAFGEPEATATGLRVPLRVSGLGDVGGARFALGEARGAWRIAGVEPAVVPSNWLAMHAPSGDDVGVALLRVGREAAAVVDESLELAVLLEPSGTAPGGGELRVSGAEFSGTDGVRLVVTSVEPAMPIGDPAALTLSPAAPNPFDAGTTFRLALGSRAPVTVGVYDLAGRRVALLHDGVLPPGVHPFTWDGRRDDGSRATGGVYFSRAESAGRTTARKLVLLGAR